LKRKRRIEITRYSRRVTAVEGWDTSDTTALPTVSDTMADVIESIAPAPEEYREDETTAHGAATYKTPGRRLAIKLRDLLRLRR
jgi:hypothetical protein